MVCFNYSVPQILNAWHEYSNITCSPNHTHNGGMNKGKPHSSWNKYLAMFFGISNQGTISYCHSVRTDAIYYLFLLMKAESEQLIISSSGSINYSHHLLGQWSYPLLLITSHGLSVLQRSEGSGRAPAWRISGSQRENTSKKYVNI